MLRRLAAALLLAAAAATPARAQPAGALLGSYRFQGCDALICADVTALVRASADSPYRISFTGSLTPLPGYFTTFGLGVGTRGDIVAAFRVPGSGFATENPWVTGIIAGGAVTPAAPTLTFGETGTGRSLTGTVDAVEFRYFNNRTVVWTPVSMTAVTATPEPATLALVGGGLLLVGVVARRRRA